MRRSMVPILPPSERRTGVPSTPSLAIKLWDWRVDVSVCIAASISHSASVSAWANRGRWLSWTNALEACAVPTIRTAAALRPPETARGKPRRRQTEPGTPAPACLRARPAGRAPRPGWARRSGARSPEPRHQPIQSVEPCPDLSFRHDALDVEHLEKLFDADDGHLKIAVETAARAELEDAGAHRDHVLLRQPRLGDLDLAAARLPFLEPHRPGLGRDVVHAAQYGCDVGIDRLGGERSELGREGGFEPQRDFDKRIIGGGALSLAAMQLQSLCAKYGAVGGDAGIADGRGDERKRAAPHGGRQSAHAGLTEGPIDDAG